MAKWIALLRGINVGGAGRLAMQDLAKVFAAAGAADVATYIQSGNVVFAARIDAPEKFATRIGVAIEKSHGFRPAVMLVSAQALAEVIARNPYGAAESTPQTLHVFFLECVPGKSALAALQRLAGPTERFGLAGTTLYLHAPDGIGRSKLVKGIDKALGMSTTARNWNTITKLAEMAKN